MAVCFSEGFVELPWLRSLTLSLSLSPSLSAAHWKGHPDTAECRYSVWAATWLSSVLSPSSPSRAPACPHSTLNLSPPPHSPLSSARKSVCSSLAQFARSPGLKCSVLIHDRYLGWGGWQWNVSHHHLLMLLSDLLTSFIIMQAWVGTDRPTCP